MVPPVSDIWYPRRHWRYHGFVSHSSSLKSLAFCNTILQSVCAGQLNWCPAPYECVALLRTLWGNLAKARPPHVTACALGTCTMHACVPLLLSLLGNLADVAHAWVQAAPSMPAQRASVRSSRFRSHQCTFMAQIPSVPLCGSGRRTAQPGHAVLDSDLTRVLIR